MRIGLRIPPCLPTGRIAEMACTAEHAGFDEVWIPDSQLLWRDVFAVTAAAAVVTSRVRLGTAVTNVVTRHPSVLASAARTVEEIAPGRFVLGVGVGDSSVSTLGLRPATGAQLRERLTVVRELLGGEDVDFGAGPGRLRDPIEVPIHIAASGPRNLQLAGEIGDGAILLSGVAPAPLAAAISRVHTGAGLAGRGRTCITVSAFCRVTDDVPRAARELKPVCARIAQNGGASFLALAGVEVGRIPPTLPGVYPDLVHAEDWDAAVRACDPYVSDEAVAAFAREFCLYGTAHEIASRLGEVRDVGVDAVFLQHVGSYDLPHELLTAVGAQVMPLVRAGLQA